MLKLLEKYKKHVLVVGGSLLMVAFVMPSAVGQMRGDPGKRVVAYMGDEKVLARDIHLAEREFRAITRIAPSLISGNMGIADGEHWLMMSREAERAGFVGAESDGQLFVSDLEPFVGMELARSRFGANADMILNFNAQARQEVMDSAKKALPNLVRFAARDAQLTEKEIYVALAKVRGALRLQNMYILAAKFSDRRVQHGSVRRLDNIRVDNVVIPASRLIDRVPEPTDAELVAHFEQYKSADPGTGEFGLGYVQPDRVKIEWIKIDRQAIAASIAVDPVEANKRWRAENPAKPAEEFGKDRAGVDAAIRNEKTDAVMTQIDKVWRAQVLSALRKLEPDGSYRKLPADWETVKPNLETLAASIVEGVKAAMNATIPLPTVERRGATWTTAQTIRTLPGIGSGSVQFGSRSIPFAEVAMKVRELRDPADKDLAELAVQAGIPSSEAIVTDGARNRYYFMITEAKKKAPPASLDEVREQVTLGVKKLKAYALMQDESASWEAKAEAEGIQALTTLFPDPTVESLSSSTPPERVEVSPETLISRQEVRGADRRIQVDAFRDAAWQAAGGIDPLKPVEDVPIADRTFVVPLPASLAVAVGQISGVEPLTIETYRSEIDRQTMMQQFDEIRALPEAARNDLPFTRARMVERLKFRPVGRDGEPANDATPPANAGGGDTAADQKKG